MAKVMGQAGRYVSDEAQKRSNSILLSGMVAVGGLSLIGGFLLGSSFHRINIPGWASLPIAVALALVAVGITIWNNKKLGELDKERAHLRHGATGEFTVARALARFPDKFCVLHDIATPFGNLDHVVVGPTGVFVLDAKNWRGVVSADGRGELFLNDRPTDKPFVKQFVARVMSIKEKVRVLAPEFDPFFHAVFVFTSARVDANWGRTGRVDCIRDTQLFDYIVEKRFGRKLPPHEVERVAQAFLSLAKIDTDFPAGTGAAVAVNTGKSRLTSPLIQQAC